ncbi:hypothetical protein [Actibacterium sp. XHP0104]|uniref:hypothetical protein n=1 Tax=Actibacterium sp. XHP0104 TaxID=2984335 RepID=UPI0021E92958|nr:hypothetical protein [Actibacterium sp. XHP0104]MCV2882447.1 hypothetical protein [Actibacterium sp. XHP0104]
MNAIFSKLRTGAFAAGMVLLAACTASNDLNEPPVPMGDFLLGYAIVVADEAKMVPPSRSATPEEWKAVLSDQVKQRFGRYDGTRYYHIALAVDAYALAVPGVPVLVSPKSALVVSATIWDDEAGKKLNEEPKQITILENISGKTFIGSGLTQTREVQMENLSRNAAKKVEEWMSENAAEWFGEIGAAPMAELSEDAAPAPEGEISVQPLAPVAQ